MRLYISADIEGVHGVTARCQLRPGGHEYEDARRWMTSEVDAVARTALENNFSEIVVSDSHGNGLNLLPDKLPRRVRLVRSWPRPLGMMQGIEVGTFDAAMLIGFHAGAADARGVLAHTVDGASFSDVRINGSSASETVICALIAGHFHVPIVLVSGDEQFLSGLASFLPDSEFAPTKYAYSFSSTNTLCTEDALDALREKSIIALTRRKEIKPKMAEGPLKVAIEFKDRSAADAVAMFPRTERDDHRTVCFLANDILEASRFVEVAAITAHGAAA